ncbi:hypothetical protein C8F01DRAFT_1366890 [Mycena amicta]|nr:hypothetical protein C8F01DRAFT_1366890 [Mycena amicta]
MCAVPDQIEPKKSGWKSSLPSVTLSNHHLRTLSQPLLFAHFEFHPYAIGDMDQILLPETRDIEHSLERLAFWCSPRIAPHVRTCVVSPWRKLESWANWNFSLTTAPYAMLSAFLKGLKNFTSLQRLVLRNVHLSSANILDFTDLRTLEHLETERCTITPSADEAAGAAGVDPKLSLKSLHIMANILGGDETLQPWLALLDTGAVLNLDLACDLRSWTDNPDAVPYFPNALSLSLNGNLALFGIYMRILSHFPVLRQLAFEGWGVPDSYTTNPFQWPELRSLRTNFALIPLLIGPETTPTLVELGVSYCPYGSLSTALASVHTVNSLQAITSLFVDLDTGDYDMDSEDTPCTVLEPILEFFPNLTQLEATLYYEIQEGMLDDTDGFNPMATRFFADFPTLSSLPTKLKYLAIKWSFDYEDDPKDVPPQYEEAFVPVDVRDALVSRLPEIQSIWLDGSLFLYQWRRGLGSEEDEEAFADNSDDAEKMREGYERFKELPS